MLNNTNDNFGRIGRTVLIRDEVYGWIREDILACTLVPGSLLQERELAIRYAVSKSPVRDALLRLQEQGLIEVLPRKGYRVSPISLADAGDLYDMRILLETACIKRVIENVSDSELECLEKFRMVEDYSNLRQWVTYNRDFHRTMAGLSGNTRLIKMSHQIIDQFDRLTFVNVSSAPDNLSAERLVSEHSDIIDSILVRDKTKSMRLIKGHIQKSKKRLFEILENPPIVR